MISGSVDNVISAAGLPYLFGMRLLYPGFSKLVSSFNLKRPGGTRPGPVHRLGSSIGSGRTFPGLRPSPGRPHLSILSGSLLTVCAPVDASHRLAVLAAKQQLMIPQGGFIC